MKSYVKYIGVVGNSGRVHSVEFGPGVNIVTGKSSTGKSALIEIFDYCFGSSDFTVPDGVITDNADIYFVVMSVVDTFIVLGRKANGSMIFLKEEFDEELLSSSYSFNHAYFEDKYFVPSAHFNKYLGRFFDLRITDVDEDLTDRAKRRQQKKKPTPSVRSFTSFMLQHQNLVANKHAIFYRFDEKEKREQVIDHMKIFLGFADQEYFIKQQRLNQLKADKRSLEVQAPRAEKEKAANKIKFSDMLKDYASIAGHKLQSEALDDAIENPAAALDFLEGADIKIVTVSDEHQKLKNEIDRVLAKRTAELRAGQQKLADIRASISFAKSYDGIAESITYPDDAEIKASQCPFCQSHQANIETAANKLTDAIDWLNGELMRSRYHLESFEEDESKQVKEVERLKDLVKESTDKVNKINKQIFELAKNKTQYQLAIRAKMGMESFLGTLLDKERVDLDGKLKDLKSEIDKLEEELQEKYNIYSKMKSAEDAVHSHMKSISKNLEFEESYKPVDLRFSFETFDLWNKKGSKKTFLRSMGSGANWLSSHVTLFLALHRYFCQLGECCKIPSVLFLDQPSQVYFPSIVDTASEFRPQELAEKVGKDTSKQAVDEDIAAVANLYSQLVSFCSETAKLTKIIPQIIVTDHADNLELDGGVPFESLVRAKWRTRGFIEEI